MFKMKRKLTKLNLVGDVIRIGLVGLGKMGSGLVHQIHRIDGMRTSFVVDELTDRAYKTLLDAGIDPREIVRTEDQEEVQKAIEEDKYVVTSDYKLGLKCPGISAMVDATGNPPFGAELAYNSIKAKKHVIMLNVECDALIGPILNMYAKENGVVYTGSAGDEPGAIMEIADFAVSLGFELLAVGKGKNNPLNHYIRPEDVKEEAEEKGLYPKILSSFIDGTNTMIELNSVCNALGFLPDIMGCHGVTASPNEIAGLFRLKEEGGILNSYQIVDFAFGMAPGVFAIVTHEAKEVKDLMKYLSMGDGPNYCIHRPYHLTSLETPITIYDAVIENEPTIAPQYGQVADVITVAKRDLEAGEIIEGMGGKDVYGTLTSHQFQKENSYLPIALIGKETKILQDVKQGDLIKTNMVDLNKDSMIYKLRKEQEELGL